MNPRSMSAHKSSEISSKLMNLTQSNNQIEATTFLPAAAKNPILSRASGQNPRFLRVKLDRLAKLRARKAKAVITLSNV
jgi:hypothetical protein